MAEQRDVIVALVPAVRAGSDPEAIHDTRVAIRRLRAALGLFEPVIPQRGARLRSELKWLTRELGHVRDLDVMSEQLKEWREEAAPEERAGFDELEGLLTERRTKEHVRVVRALDTRRFATLGEGLDGFLARGPSSRSQAAGMPALVVVPELVAKRYRSLRKAGRKVGTHSPAPELHKLRIRAKRLRYALEFVSPLYVDSTKTMIRRVTRLQDVLGELQDTEVAIAHLHELGEKAGRRLPSEAVFAMGRLAERHRRRAAVLRRGFAGKVQALQGKRWKQLKREMERGRRAGAVPLLD